ncbi:cytochrome-c peroxidase [Formosa sp. 3Alg 14/1]|uniref:cytochrome-c peroxidase n=1 Tax=Formosa sp. 3Alg 14/1 TaxID=3382190 RepID=UPI0039BE27E2
MKKGSLLVLTIVICFILLSGKNSERPYQSIIVTKKVEESYQINFLNFQKEVDKLESLTTFERSKDVFLSIKKQVLNTRLAYKEIEFIFDYYQTPYNGTFINGAPLPKISEYFDEGNVIAPSGLQALDEAVYEDYSLENFDHIKVLAKDLKEHVDHVSEIHLPIRLKSSQIIECIRSGLVRVFTLGVTGFDTPGSVNGITESYISFKRMRKTFMTFEAGIYPEARPKFKSIVNLFLEGEELLKSNDNFNEFNRLTFLKHIINPLYAELLEFQNLNNIRLEPYKKHAQNYQAKNLFDIDFLNTDFYSELVYLPLDNDKTIYLGKLLFEDPQLSGNHKMSCLSCHNPKKGFSDGLPKSLSNKEGFTTLRNSPSLLNVGYSTRYFWDMRASNLETQVGHVINNKLEFNTDFDAIIEKLNNDSKYLKLFKDAYAGISEKDINQRSISNAIAAYVNSLKSFNSTFDKYVRNEIEDYPQSAKRGFNLFMGKGACGSCHFAPVFNGSVPPFYLDSESEVLGITQGFDAINPKLDLDLGRIANGIQIDKFSHFKNSFKTVSVRNVALTAPYMHNGSFKTLEDVLEFYNLGGGAGMGLDIDNQTLSKEPLLLSKQEIKDIIAFLKTLTDPTGFVVEKKG